jgi:hypothetical protein
MWTAIIGAVLGGISNRSAQRSAQRAQERAAEQALVNMRESGDEARRTEMFRSDLTEYERSRDRERKRSGLENFVQFGMNQDGSNRWGFMDQYVPVNSVRETPTRPNYEDYAYREEGNRRG